MDLTVCFALAAMIITALGAVAFKPSRIVESPPGRLAALIPDQLSDWHEILDGPQQVSLVAIDDNGKNPMDEVYDDSLLRSYVNRVGDRIMLAIAYDRIQREEDRVHRPEICYIAQGFSIISDAPVTFRLVDQSPPIEGRQMLTRRGSRFEAVTYWIRTGNSFSQNPWRSRTYVLEEGLAGRLHDGVLVRASEIIAAPGDASRSFTRQQKFLAALISNVDPATGVTLARRGLGDDRL